MAAVLAVAGGCSADLGSDVGAPTTLGDDGLPAVVDRLVGDRPAPTADVVEVWVCDVPRDTSVALYGGLPLRQPLSPDDVVRRIGAPVAEYVRTLSQGRTSVQMVAGGTVTMDADDTDAECVERALDDSRPTSLAVLAVATAEHGADEPGGWGRTGTALACTGACPASDTRRAAYVGASDFHPDWGPTPLLDLILHEYLHTVGLPHSGAASTDRRGYTSALDVMSDSAAPTRADPDRRDAGSTLAINLLDLGWLDLDAVRVAEGAETVDGVETVELHPSPSSNGVRLLVLPVDEHRVLTVEMITATGLDRHLPESGVAVHLVDDRTGTDVLREQLPVHSAAPPFTDLLGASDVLEANGWRIEVTTVGTSAVVRVARTDVVTDDPG